MSQPPPPSETDRYLAQRLVDYFDNLDALGSFAGEDVRIGKENFAALMLRNVRLNLGGEEGRK